MFRESSVSCLLLVVQIWVFPVLLHVVQILVFPVCYMLYRHGYFLFVTCCTDIGVSCLLHVVQI